jgi:hypothetical protein
MGYLGTSLQFIIYEYIAYLGNEEKGEWAHHKILLS